MREQLKELLFVYQTKIKFIDEELASKNPILSKSILKRDKKHFREFVSKLTTILKS